ncbi:DUF1266 domain-containing protein [Paenibacillus fonticola]|uniref:DUF1266 domain-containing protein n=1 Tax=Paenibacillus fonticola TaxID=379896 RepID=UPI000370BFBD|nr:DUF1266 domain-containing protein [Paenibacillus fonticola]
MLGVNWRKRTYYQAMTAVFFIGNPLDDQAVRHCGDLRSCPRPILQSWLFRWGIEDSLTLHDRLNWLLYKGHRMKFNEVKQTLSTMSYEMREQYIASLPELSILKNNYSAVNKFMNHLGPEGIAAYDYALYLALSQAGVSLKYRTRRDDRYYAREIAEIAQRKYTGWDDYNMACIAGMYFLAPPTEEPYLHNRSYLYTRLLVQKNSVMNRVNWNAKL